METNNIIYMQFEVLTAEKILTLVFWILTQISTFQRNILPLSSGLKTEDGDSMFL
jgi:hypothetical protein